MRRRLVLLGLLSWAMLVPAHAGQTDDCAPPAGEPVVIGGVFPSGALFSPQLGEALRGVEALLGAYNACGGSDARPVDWRPLTANNRAEADLAMAEHLASGVGIVVGGGAPAVSERLAEIAEREDVVYWEVSEALNEAAQSGAWTFTPRPTHRQIGDRAARYIQAELAADLGLESARLALVYEERDAARAVAEGVRAAFADPDAAGEIIIERAYENVLPDPYALALAMREQEVNVVVFASFDNDADNLWLAMREADANVAAWMHIGNEGYRQNMCERIGHSEGFISIGAGGPVSEAYRMAADSPMYAQYRAAFGDAVPSETADLSAAGLYALLRIVLPALDESRQPDAEAWRTAILRAEGDAGLMGYGYAPASRRALNAGAGVIVQQRQDGVLCSIAPGEIATCALPAQPMPTWRARALAAERDGCGG